MAEKTGMFWSGFRNTAVRSSRRSRFDRVRDLSAARAWRARLRTESQPAERKWRLVVARDFRGTEDLLDEGCGLGASSIAITT
jgi:hypothetical protein